MRNFLIASAVLALLTGTATAAERDGWPGSPMRLDAAQMDSVTAGIIRLPRVPSLRDAGFAIPRLPRVPSVGRVPSVDAIFDLHRLLGR